MSTNPELASWQLMARLLQSTCLQLIDELTVDNLLQAEDRCTLVPVVVAMAQGLHCGRSSYHVHVPCALRPKLLPAPLPLPLPL